MPERRFFRSHSASKILGIDHVIEGGKIVGRSIWKTTKYNGKPNKTWSISTVLIVNKAEGFRSSEKVR